MARSEGFGVQLVYTDDRSLDEAIQVRDGDVVLVPRGYHPVAAGPGYDLYYLNVMAGPRRRWLVTTDPDHRWQLD
jgi:5-deoxy-glucuronate isomerase